MMENYHTTKLHFGHCVDQIEFRRRFFRDCSRF